MIGRRRADAQAETWASGRNTTTAEITKYVLRNEVLPRLEAASTAATWMLLDTSLDRTSMLEQVVKLTDRAAAFAERVA